MASLREAVTIVRRGGLVGFPTESFFALGADATNSAAIKLIYTVKGREPGKPIALIASDIQQVRKFFVLSGDELKLAQQHWPGALTLLLRPKALSSGRRGIAARALNSKKIGVRVPAHVAARALAKALGRPVTATSLNISGQSATKSRRITDRDFPGLQVLSGTCGFATKPSTVVEVLNGKMHILRAGSVRV